MRLLMATCKKFVEYCTKNGIALPNRNFTVSYDTNIPRQVGLAGSSAIVSALFKALMAFYGLNDLDIPIERQPVLFECRDGRVIHQRWPTRSCCANLRRTGLYGF